MPTVQCRDMTTFTKNSSHTLKKTDTTVLMACWCHGQEIIMNMHSTTTVGDIAHLRISPKTVLEKTTMYANTQRATANGALITGFAPDIDKDIVWLEGTGQMVVAYQKAADSYKSTTYLAEMRNRY